MGAVRGWLLAVIAASLLCALAEALMPQGAVRRVGKLVCGLVIMAAILSPVAGLDTAASQAWLEDYFSGLERRRAELTQTVERQRKTIIERECAAYIVDKAAEFGWTCTAQVVCEEREEGLYLPIRAEIWGELADYGQARLREVIVQDLGVPEDQITFEEEMP